MYDQDGNKSELFDFIKVESENINRDGLLLLKIPCYSHHVITNEYGEEVFSTFLHQSLSHRAAVYRPGSGIGTVPAGLFFPGHRLRRNCRQDRS